MLFTKPATEPLYLPDPRQRLSRGLTMVERSSFPSLRCLWLRPTAMPLSITVGWEQPWNCFRRACLSSSCREALISPKRPCE